MRYKVQTALEEIVADFPDEAFHKFLNDIREITVIVEEDDPTSDLGFKVHEYTTLPFNAYTNICGHKRWGETTYCAEMSCPNYINKH